MTVLFQYYNRHSNKKRMPLHLDGMDDLLNKYVVADEGITDVLGVARYDSLWYNIEDFLKDK